MILVQLDFSPNSCGNQPGFSKFTWLNILVIILASASLVLEVLQILQTVNTIRNLRNQFLSHS